MEPMESANEVVTLLTGGLESLKDASSFLKKQGVETEIMRPEDCNINS
jgi:hypothetical protein